MKILFVSLSALFVLGCVTQPVVQNLEKTQGQWQTKTQVKNLKNSQSNVVGIDFIAVRPNKLRAEVSGPFGVSVATLTINEKQIAYAAHHSKRFYAGAISERSLLPLLQVPLNPYLLFNILFDQKISSGGWSCRYDDKGRPEQCENNGSHIKISWFERNAENKRVNIQAPDYEVVVLVKSFNPEVPTKVQSDPQFFTLVAPPAYKSYHLN